MGNFSRKNCCDNNHYNYSSGTVASSTLPSNNKNLWRIAINAMCKRNTCEDLHFFLSGLRLPAGRSYVLGRVLWKEKILLLPPISIQWNVAKLNWYKILFKSNLRDFVFHLCVMRHAWHYVYAILRIRSNILFFKNNLNKPF